MTGPYRLRILWHRAMVLFYFDNPAKQEKHIAELYQYLTWNENATNKGKH